VSISKHQILASLATIEKQSPLCFGAMPVADDIIRDIFAASLAGLNASSDFRRATPHAREVSLLATLTHALLEAACLRYQLQASGQAAAGETDRLLARVATH
jgi:hypothetical protein